MNCNREWYYESFFCYLYVDAKDWAEHKQGAVEAASLKAKGRALGNCFNPKDTREIDKYCGLCAE
eukprot:6800407-Lingulodinium_polyedra.AAC.1